MTSPPNHWHGPRVLLQHEGRIAIVTTRGAGCDGRERIVRRAMRERTAKACGPGALVAGANPRVEEPGGTVTQKPVSPGRARYRPLTPSRRECRCFGFICGDYTCVLSTIAHKAAGAAKHPAFPAPSSFIEGDRRTISGAPRRGNAEVRLAV